jgi:hypothetical protein
MYKKSYVILKEEDVDGQILFQNSSLDMDKMKEQSKDLEHEEFYPKILVYKNLFKDLEKTMRVLKRSEDESEQDPAKRNSMFNSWHDWYIFGLELDQWNLGRTEESEQTKEESEVLNEIIENFYKVVFNYTSQHEIPNKKWFRMGPSICKYIGGVSQDGPADDLVMHYHSDYQLENIDEPGHKFGITVTMYLNDDYTGGEVDFLIDNKVKMFTPKAGDIMVFPAGNPEVLTDVTPYYHGVKKITEGNKYFIRCNWVYYYPGTPEWHANKEKYGDQLWEEMERERKNKQRELGLFHVIPKDTERMQ